MVDISWRQPILKHAKFVLIYNRVDSNRFKCERDLKMKLIAKGELQNAESQGGMGARGAFGSWAVFMRNKMNRVLPIGQNMG
jgi:hypothetical protein